MQTGTLRRYWVIAHRWLGVIAGLLFCVIGLSGSVLVYYPQIDQLLNPALVLPQDRGAPQPIVRILQSAAAHANGRFVHSVYPAGSEWPVHHVWLTPSATDQSRMWELLVDPASARVLGERRAVPVFDPTRRNLMNTVYTLHYNLFAGTIGATLVGIVGLLMIASAISGIMLWWPRGQKWRQALTLKRGARGHRLHVDLHRLAGGYGAVLLLVASVTGVCLVFPDYVEALFPPAKSGTASAEQFRLPSAARPVDADGIIAAARAAVPGGTVRLLWLPGARDANWQVTLRQPTGVALAGGSATVAIDAASGRIVKRVLHEAAGPAASFLAWQLPLHNGTAFGAAGRVLMCVAGLLPTMLFATGLLIYLRKRRARSKAGGVMVPKAAEHAKP